jgi:hypothetical protein
MSALPEARVPPRDRTWRELASACSLPRPAERPPHTTRSARARLTVVRLRSRAGASSRSNAQVQLRHVPARGRVVAQRKRHNPEANVGVLRLLVLCVSLRRSPVRMSLRPHPHAARRGAGEQAAAGLARDQRLGGAAPARVPSLPQENRRPPNGGRFVDVGKRPLAGRAAVAGLGVARAANTRAPRGRENEDRRSPASSTRNRHKAGPAQIP